MFPGMDRIAAGTRLFAAFYRPVMALGYQLNRLLMVRLLTCAIKAACCSGRTWVDLAINLRRFRYRVTQRPCPTKAGRSEEHTSELQSREKLVCRLLLEKRRR